MSQLYRFVPRFTSNIIYVSRMNAHTLPPGSAAKVPEAKTGNHIVSGSGQFIATNSSSTTTKTGTSGSSSNSTLPGAQTANDKTNPRKTIEDAKDNSDKAYE